MNGESSKVCRLCLAEAEVMCPIFNSFSKSNPQSVALPQRIMSFAQIKVCTAGWFDNYFVVVLVDFVIHSDLVRIQWWEFSPPIWGKSQFSIMSSPWTQAKALFKFCFSTSHCSTIHKEDHQTKVHHIQTSFRKIKGETNIVYSKSIIVSKY